MCSVNKLRFLTEDFSTLPIYMYLLPGVETLMSNKTFTQSFPLIDHQRNTGEMGAAMTDFPKLTAFMSSSLSRFLNEPLAGRSVGRSYNVHYTHTGSFQMDPLMAKQMWALLIRTLPHSPHTPVWCVSLQILLLLKDGLRCFQERMSSCHVGPVYSCTHDCPALSQEQLVRQVRQKCDSTWGIS